MYIRYALAHLTGKCRRKVILEYFQECDSDPEVDAQCCDVCMQSESLQLESFECQEELAAIVEVVREFPNKGIKKVILCLIILPLISSHVTKCIFQVAELLRGYNKGKAIESTSLGTGASFRLSETAWRTRILQAWLCGYLTRSTTLGRGHGRMTEIVFNTYTITEAGSEFSTSEPLPSVRLPSTSLSTKQFDSPSSTKMGSATVNPSGSKLRRKSKGTHLLPKLIELLSSSENWYTIEDPDDYQYPGKFQRDHPHRLGYASDISALPFYTKEDEHFLFNDIQLSKEKPRAPRKISVTVDGKEEELQYRIAPCGGVKSCSASDCSYAAPKRESRPCPKHRESVLVQSDPCPVEFVYVWPTSSDDKRRWLSGLVRRSEMLNNNLHNHPLHGPTKVPAKVVSDIQQALQLDSSLETHDILTGSCEYLLRTNH